MIQKKIMIDIIITYLLFHNLHLLYDNIKKT